MDGIRNLRCRVRRERIGPGPAAEQIAADLGDADDLVCLTGTWAGGTAIVASQPLLVLPADADGFAALDCMPLIESSEAGGDVVGGGWFGVFGYDGTHLLAFYDHLLRHADGIWYFEALVSDARAATLADRQRALAARVGADDNTHPTFSVGAFTAPPRDSHLAAVERAVEHIRAGDIYQVNVCTRLTADFAGSPAALFRAAAGSLAPAHGAFVRSGERAVASMSPELFLRRTGRDVVTAPIKGTRPRVAGDPAGAELLRRSAKDAAENVMIVDLMRNDLGRVCETGSVAAVKLLDVEAHPGVWHLVSRVTGTLRADVGDEQLLDATFPPGSVTGAPKVRATQIIGELEAAARGIYTGAIGFVSPVYGAEFNVAIRTFEFAPGRVELGVGGGITADSVPMLEWHECLHKAAPLLGALGATSDALLTSRVQASPGQLASGVFETVLVLDGRPVRLADHLARLDRSRRELYGTGLPDDLAARARVTAITCGPGRAALRIAATAVEVSISTRPVGAPPTGSAAVLVPGRAGLWRHKWADRGVLDAAEASAGGAVPVFVDERGFVLETSRGNLYVLHADGSLVTPPLSDDLLPGVTRRALLDLAHDSGRRAELRMFGVDEMVAGAPFWTSSLSGAVPIRSVDGVPARYDAGGAIATFARLLSGGDQTIR